MGVKLKYLSIVIIILGSFGVLKAQVKTTSINIPIKPVKKERYTIAIIAPLYLDSFDIVKSLTALPAYAMPGLDFYTGAMIAADTLNSMQEKITFYVYDSKSRYLNVNTMITTDKFDNVDCIIGILGGNDLKTIAEFAKSKHINFISCVSPSDADQKNNPFFTLLAPRLISHLEKINHKIELFYADAHKVYMHVDNNADNNAYNLYSKLQGTDMCKEIKVTNEPITTNELAKQLDKKKTNVLIMGIMNAALAYENLMVVANLVAQGYTIKVMGMPTWDGVSTIKEDEALRDIDIFITTPLYINKESKEVKNILNNYKIKMGGNPSDNVYKGFESVLFASYMLNTFGTPFNDALVDSRFSYITPYKIQKCVENNVWKYNENKNVYMMHYKNGIILYE
jgi:hypothetical protein